jgi:hypothetical protein
MPTLSPHSATPLKPFRLVCRNQWPFGSRAAMNVLRGLPFCVQTPRRRSDQDPGSTGADLWRRSGVALFDSLSVMINPQSRPIWRRVPPVAPRQFSRK